ncbi:DUF3265 domain-containing protein [Vibrio alginolyticus]|nr:DUF3265 domain-containing protein [Vibrio alginolyticus]MBS9889032.1 DUF3265 domain-containing protein [Vibrio alginolyticus]QCO87643.1 DUF3265 domain-containing protein [Vibrio neocaledonicus]
MFKRDSQRVAFLVCVGFGVEVPCRNLVIACFPPQLGVIALGDSVALIAISITACLWHKMR